ncbi:conserved hypothetical protein [Cupriavidus taiwanensis]|nr:conserved hypothetical protein [Cupriavidus taiwanensis]SOZ26356.1 conserved hypothetical protein [Cupriavidus taiwanensis]SOZ45220.1 conserved hypothetical protein [Cupriavidus taiwanensis]
MLKLTETQWQALQQTDARNFVGAVCDQFLNARPDLLMSLGRDAICNRMEAGHELAATVGLRSTAHIVSLLYLCADAPQFATDPEIQAYLLKPAASPEQRLDDLSAVMTNILRETP